MKQLLIILCFVFSWAINSFGQDKPRVIILTDIGQPDLEPDDTESLVRLLCYADRLEIEGIITSTGWNCDPYPTESAAYRDSVVAAYGVDVHNLMKRSNQMHFLPLKKENGKQRLGYWPSVDYIKGRCAMGSQRAGIGVIGEGNDSPGSELIIQQVDEKDDRPIWVCAWGGANTLAQAIWRVKQTRSAEELQRFLNKLRLYTITDQDMVYAMRENLDYSSHKWLRKEFANDLLFVWDEGAWQLQCSLGQEYWQVFQTRIQGHATLGRHYPNYKYGVEGDTPSFLNVIPNGLHNPENPEETGWGGYHQWSICKDNETFAWNSWQQPTKSISENYYRKFFPDQLNDFVARIEWAEKGRGNRNPVVVINGCKGYAPVSVKAVAGKQVVVDASKSYDPDGDALIFRWWQQPEIGNCKVEILSADSSKATIAIPSNAQSDTVHIVCEVHDQGAHKLVAYKRIIIEIK